MARRRKPASPVGINLCSLCETFALTLGGQEHGGVRYCRDCIQTTLGWIQTPADRRERVLAIMDKAAATEPTKSLLAALAATPEDARRAIGVGESRRRLMDAGQ